MSIFLLIISILAWLVALVMLPSRPLYSPALSSLGLVGMSLCKTDGLAWVPISNSMLISWLTITVVVMMATFLQPAVIKSQTRGMGYMIGGAIVGLAIGLLGYTMTSVISTMYAIMMLGVVVGIFFGFLMYSNTPDGSDVRMSSGNFFKYLFAKGFPTAVTVMQIGVVLVILIAVSDLSK